MASNGTFEPFSSPSSSSSRRLWSYDVFLSFRGGDTRKNFTDHLYFALKKAGINAYRDDNELPRGRDIESELHKAIQESMISLIVFSRNYAGSRWCLDELVKIMDCQKTVQQVVLPIFYDINPSDVRKQTGSFEEAFSKHEERFTVDMDKVLRWRVALTKAANSSGWDLTIAKDGNEATIIKNIVKVILNHLNNPFLHVAKYPVGIGSRVQCMNKLLSVGSNDVRIIGICAMGGMGKTTIAKAVFNQLFFNFTDKSFLANVRETSKQPNGQVRLQEQLLCDILKMRKIKVNNVDRGINVIKERLRNKRILLVLDDVDESCQLNAIAGKRDWFGLGSRIIITTRDEHLLKKIEVDDIYMLDGLHYYESLELFSWHAFMRSHPQEDYIKLSNDVILYCQGLPLALEVLGSFLFGRSIPEWTSTLERLKRTPAKQIQEKLMISFDALDDEEKDIFLDIACFFIELDKDYVLQILDGCGFFAEVGISVLIQRCLLKINEYNKLTMHDLLRDMGREIVCEESPKEPGNCSRLWSYDDVIDILMKHTGTAAVEGLILKLPTLNKVRLSTKTFSKMHKLRLLQLNYVHLIEGNDHHFKELRWLCWHGCPLKFIPDSFHLENLVAVDMRYSNLKQVWKEIKFLERLKFLNLSHSHYLTKTPDFLQLPNLEKLKLKDCTSLVEVHPSIGHLDRLILVNMRDCKRLKNLPTSICMLKSLEVLNLAGCSKIEELPEDLGEMKALIELLADGTAIREVPSSIVRLKNLKNLSLSGYKSSPSSSSFVSIFKSWVSSRKSLDFGLRLPTSLMALTSLIDLSLKDLNISDEAIPKDLGSLSSLKNLDLQGNNFCSLPASIGNLPRLWWLKLDHCTRLQSLEELPTSLIGLEAPGCTSLKRIPNLSNFRCTPELILTNCSNLVEVPGLGKSQTYRNIRMAGCNNLSNTFKESLLQLPNISQVLCFGSLVVPVDEIPHWVSHQCAGPSLSFRLPVILGCKVKGFAVCAIYRYNINININEPILQNVDYNKDRKKLSLDICTGTATYATCQVPTSPQDHIWASTYTFYVDNLSSLSQLEVEVSISAELHVKKFGLKLLYDDAERRVQSGSGELASNQNDIVVGDDDQDLFEDQAGSKGLKRDPHDDDDDDEAGPSHGWSDEEPHAKRPRYQSGSSAVN